jgi:hypothetical protein
MRRLGYEMRGTDFGDNMPLHDLVFNYSDEHATLVEELAEEWRHPRADDSEPKIFVERTPQGKPHHVYVVWSKWANVDRVERSEIIMDAAERVHGQHDAAEITIAMGLGSSQEARNFGIKT